MKFCIFVNHDLTNDTSYETKVNRLKMAILGVKYSTFREKKITRNGQIFVVSIFVDILVHNFKSDAIYNMGQMRIWGI